MEVASKISARLLGLDDWLRYCRADTEGLWQVPGLNYHDGMGSYDLHNPRLLAAFEELQGQVSAPGRWSLGGTQLPFGEELQSKPAVSRLSPEIAARSLEGAFSLANR